MDQYYQVEEPLHSTRDKVISNRTKVRHIKHWLITCSNIYKIPAIPWAAPKYTLSCQCHNKGLSDFIWAEYCFPDFNMLFITCNYRWSKLKEILFGVSNNFYFISYYFYTFSIWFTGIISFPLICLLTNNKA